MPNTVCTFFARKFKINYSILSVAFFIYLKLIQNKKIKVFKTYPIKKKIYSFKSKIQISKIFRTKKNEKQ